MTNITTNAKNDLRFSTSKTVGNETIYVKIRLNDECKNGHQDFSITGDIYKAGKAKIDSNHICGGCIHENIEKYFPEFKIFINLHLCDYEGIPMYAVENGFYHLTNGFNNTTIESPLFKNEFCDYYRISTEQFESLKQSKNKLQYALKLQSLNILNQWKEEANKAIKMLEDMTEEKFLIDSAKTQFNAPTNEEIKAEAEKEKNGYYTPQAEQEREQEKQSGFLAALEAERDKQRNKATEEFEVKKQVLIIGGKKALDNCIFYTHTKQLSFNWKSYDNISDELINKIISTIQLPKGVTIKNELTTI